MQIKVLDQSMYSDYDRFVKSHSQLILYYSLEYKYLLQNFLECDSEYLTALDNTGQIMGVLPLMKKHGKFGVVYNSLPFYGSNGGIFGIHQEAIDLLLFEYNRISQLPTTACSVYIENPLYNINKKPIHNFTDSRIGQITPLGILGDIEEVLMASFHTKTRNMVRKSIKSGLGLKKNNDGWDFLIQTHHENMASIGGNAKPKEFFDEVRKRFKSDKDYIIYEAQLENKTIASMLLFKFNDCVEYFTPVIKQEYRSLQPLSYLIYNAMIDCTKEGFKYWNWGGTWSSQEGVYRFKNRWNAYDHEYRYFIQLNNNDILNLSSAEIMKVYPYFYLVPFDSLIQ